MKMDINSQIMALKKAAHKSSFEGLQNYWSKEKDKYREDEEGLREGGWYGQ